LARAKRHYIPGYVWHITHRCHKRDFLLKFAKDRHRWLQWLYEAGKRYNLVILNCVVTSNHIHYERFQSEHRQWVQSALSDDGREREDRWTQSIATGSRSFVEAVKKQMRSLAIGRQVRKKARRRPKTSNFENPSQPIRIILTPKRSI
jgi:hypothetical protein